MPKNIKENKDLTKFVIGKKGTLKTSFVNKWAKNIVSDSFKEAIVSEHGFKIFAYNGKYYRVQLWDITYKVFGKDSNGFILMCDAENPENGYQKN